METPDAFSTTVLPDVCSSVTDRSTSSMMILFPSCVLMTSKDGPAFTVGAPASEPSTRYSCVCSIHPATTLVPGSSVVVTPPNKLQTEAETAGCPLIDTCTRPPPSEAVPVATTSAMHNP